MTRAAKAIWRWICMQALKFLLWRRYRHREFTTPTDVSNFLGMMLRARSSGPLSRVRFPQHMEQQ
jgi:hypothetical protein